MKTTRCDVCGTELTPYNSMQSGRHEPGNCAQHLMNQRDSALASAEAWKARAERAELALLHSVSKGHNDTCSRRADERAAVVWEDADDIWTEQIKAAHPSRTGNHDAYGIAMQMVGNRHSKGGLVALVCWLISRGDHVPK